MKFHRVLTAISLTSFFLCGCSGVQERKNKVVTDTADHSIPGIHFRVVRTLPHDTISYTEGFFIHGGNLFESTGHTSSFPGSRSLFGIVSSANGKIDIKAEIDPLKYFGEGVVFLKDRFYQLTDTTHIGFVYDGKTYKREGSFRYEGEGWGLTTDGTYLLMSNGTNNIYYREPSTFRIVKILPVTDNNGPVPNLNELEFIHGFLYANQWLTDNILKIDTSSGRVTGRLDLTELKKDARSKYPFSQETNGIAFDPAAGTLYVTGKLWPSIYEIEFQ